MRKMKYTGPGTGKDELVIEVEDNEADALEETGLWEKTRRQTTAEKEDKATEAASEKEKE